jgi:hypothetical protein
VEASIPPIFDEMDLLDGVMQLQIYKKYIFKLFMTKKIDDEWWYEKIIYGNMYSKFEICIEI